MQAMDDIVRSMTVYAATLLIVRGGPSSSASPLENLFLDAQVLLRLVWAAMKNWRSTPIAQAVSEIASPVLLVAYPVFHIASPGLLLASPVSQSGSPWLLLASPVSQSGAPEMIWCPVAIGSVAVVSVCLMPPFFGNGIVTVHQTQKVRSRCSTGAAPLFFLVPANRPRNFLRRVCFRGSCPRIRRVVVSFAFRFLFCDIIFPLPCSTKYTPTMQVLEILVL